jgi:hypothetical protein
MVSFSLSAHAINARMLVCASLVAASVAGAGAAHAGLQVTSAAGGDAASISSAVNAFRTAVSLGEANNGNGGGPFSAGRREITWDGGAAADAVSSPNLLPSNFFNNNARRGAVLTTPGEGLLQSQRVDTGTNLRFGDINPAYNEEFKVFSAPRLFAARGSTIIDTTFFVPNEPATPATVNGFGVVFTDVTLAGETHVQFFDAANQLIHCQIAQVADNGLSFIGVLFDAGERISRVRITLGNAAMSPTTFDGAGVDVVAADDFIYGEPLAVPTPGVLALAGLGGALTMRRKR